MTQSGGAKITVFSVTLSNFQKSGRAIALPAPPLCGPWKAVFPLKGHSFCFRLIRDA